MTKKIFAYLAKPDGYFAVFNQCDDGSYQFGFTEKIPESINHNIKVKDLAKTIWESREPEDILECVMVRPDWRHTDTLKTITRVSYNVATIQAANDFIGFTRTWWINKPKIWQAYFNLLEVLPKAKGDMKEAALIKLKEIMPDTKVENGLEAEAVLIGIYGIYNLLNTTVRGIKDGIRANEQ